MTKKVNGIEFHLNNAAQCLSLATREIKTDRQYKQAQVVLNELLKLQAMTEESK